MALLESLAPIIVRGAVYTSLLMLISSGFTLVFGVGRVLNLSHGIFFVLGGYITFIFLNFLGLNLWISTLLAVISVGVFSFFFQKTLISRLDTMEMTILATLAFAIFVEEFIVWRFGRLPKSIPMFISRNIKILGITVKGTSIIAIALAGTALSLLYLFINKTRLGLAIEATAQDVEIATLMGVDTDKIFGLVMFFSAAMAALAGNFYTQLYTITPEIGLMVLLFAFAIVVTGGLGSIKGSVLASVIVGYVITTVTIMISIRWSYIIALLIIIIVVIVKPSGLFGKEAK